MVTVSKVIDRMAKVNDSNPMKNVSNGDEPVLTSSKMSELCECAVLMFCDKGSKAVWESDV